MASRSRCDCAHYHTRTLPFDRRFQCPNRACPCHGLVLCEACLRKTKGDSANCFTPNEAPGALGSLLIGGLAVAGVTFLIATLWIAAAAGTLVVAAGCLVVKGVGGNLLWDLRIMPVPSTTTINGCPNCPTQVQEIPRPSQRRLRDGLGGSWPEWNDPTLI